MTREQAITVFVDATVEAIRARLTEYLTSQNGEYSLDADVCNVNESVAQGIAAALCEGFNDEPSWSLDDLRWEKLAEAFETLSCDNGPDTSPLTIDDLMRAYPTLRSMRAGMESVCLTDTVQLLGCEPIELHRILRAGEKAGKLDLIAHSRTQPIPDDELAMMFERGCELIAWWRPRS